MVAACAAVLSGCGGGKAALVKSCVDEGTEKETCDCIGGELEANLDKEVFAALVLGAQGKEEAARTALEKLPEGKQFSAVTATMSAAMKCGLS